MCTCCGEATPEFLALDHVGGGGHEHRKTVGATTLFLQLVRHGKPKPEYRLLCHNCNAAIGSYGRCPHAAPLET